MKEDLEYLGRIPIHYHGYYLRLFRDKDNYYAVKNREELNEIKNKSIFQQPKHKVIRITSRIIFTYAGKHVFFTVNSKQKEITDAIFNSVNPDLDKEIISIMHCIEGSDSGRIPQKLINAEKAVRLDRIIFDNGAYNYTSELYELSSKAEKGSVFLLTTRGYFEGYTADFEELTPNILNYFVNSIDKVRELFFNE